MIVVAVARSDRSFVRSAVRAAVGGFKLALGNGNFTTSERRVTSSVLFTVQNILPSEAEFLAINASPEAELEGEEEATL